LGDVLKKRPPFLCLFWDLILRGFCSSLPFPLDGAEKKEKRKKKKKEKK
jgi:hypothetical protein